MIAASRTRVVLEWRDDELGVISCRAESPVGFWDRYETWYERNK